MIALYKVYRFKNNILSQYDGINTISDNIYKGTGSHNDKRFLSIGFDDFRDSDFSLVYPLFNGQDPQNTEGDQKSFPSNEDLRDDRGDGRNAFGFLLSEEIEQRLWDGYDKHWGAFEATWGELTDEQCQIIRDTFSIYKDQSGMLDKLDELSNRYLGTSGSSAGSWDKERGCYVGGIYTGAKTSANHEIWERICQVTRLFYQEQYNKDFSFITWSWP